MHRTAAEPSKAQPSREIVEPPSGTCSTWEGPAWTMGSALIGWTRESAAAAAKMSKSLSEDFMHLEIAAYQVPIELLDHDA